MADEFFKTETQDFEVTQGDTLNLPFEFKDKDKNPIDDIVNWDHRLSIEDPITGEIITALIKTHSDVTPSGDGVYLNGDTFTITGLDIDADNKAVAVLTYLETSDLEPGIYPFYWKVIIDEAYRAEFTAIKGNLIILKRDT